jgi:pimeloyl-ACP methyl ester carboxylesterase
MHIPGGKLNFMGLLTALTILALPGGIRAQDKTQDKKSSDTSDSVKFDSVDGVELRGTFYPAPKAKAPAILMLHRYGGNREGWEKLAEELQKKGFAVLTFDFRGHGESTKVAPETFWKFPANANHIRGGNKQDKKAIRQSEFRAEYLPMLVNDIVAAKHYLDKQNDAGLCNSSNLILIGAEEGAALGCLWIDVEWDRRPQIQGTFNRLIYDPQGKPFGEDVAAAIWLSPAAGLNRISAGTWLRHRPEIRERTPMLFYASMGDPAGVAAANRLFDDLKKHNKAPDLTFARTDVKAGKARGVELVNGKEAKVSEEITKYLERVREKKGDNAWKMRDPGKSWFTKLVDLSNYGFQQLN